MNDAFAKEHLYQVQVQKFHAIDTPCFVDIKDYLVRGIVPVQVLYQQCKKFLPDMKHYAWEDPFYTVSVLI